MNQYLIPANSKRSMLILGLFEPVDLIIFLIGAGLTGVLMLIIPAETIKSLVIILTPVLIASAMVLPIPNHRNLWQFTANVYTYFSNRRIYRWKGWCQLYVEEQQQGE